MKLSLLFLLIFGIFVCQITTSEKKKNDKDIDNLQFDLNGDDPFDAEILADIADDLVDDEDSKVPVQLNDPAPARRRRRRRRRRRQRAQVPPAPNTNGAAQASNVFTAPQRAAASPTCPASEQTLTKCCGIAKVNNRRRRQVGDVQSSCGVRTQRKR